jgi:NADPH-dependent ferric siderophore reductase
MTTTSPAAGSPTGHRRAPRHPPQLWRVPVLRTERITPRMVRVTVGGEDLASFPGGGGDQHLVLYFYPDGVTLPEPLTLTSARVAFNTARPNMRSYTVRRHDPVRHEIDIDFVLHGGESNAGHTGGPGSAWADTARVGDSLILVGPSPAYRLDPAVGEHLLIGDETALPAIAALLAELPAGARARALIEVADAAERQPLPSAAEVRVDWLHRDGAPAGRPDRLLAAAGALVPAPDTHVWAGGERSVMVALRSQLLGAGGLPRAQVRTATYWRLGHAGSAG